jgi:Virulence factor
LFATSLFGIGQSRQHLQMRGLPPILTTTTEVLMADLIIVYWRDIPAQVIVKKGRTNAKRELSLRFTEAIDMCAMRTGAGDTDAYLAEWRKADPVPVSDELEAEADKAQAAIEAEFTKEKLVALVKAGGKLES